MIEATLAFILSPDQHCLMLWRQKPPHSHRWNAPGGKLLPGEQPLAGCRRELAEETGLQPLDLRSGGRIDCLDLDREGWLYRLHLFIAEHHRVAVALHREGKFCWLPLAKILTGKDVVHNIPLFLPLLLKGHVLHGWFYYRNNYLERYSIDLAGPGKGLSI